MENVTWEMRKRNATATFVSGKKSGRFHTTNEGKNPKSFELIHGEKRFFLERTPDGWKMEMTHPPYRAKLVPDPLPFRDLAEKILEKHPRKAAAHHQFLIAFGNGYANWLVTNKV